MIYLFIGNDIKSKSIKLKLLSKGGSITFLSLKDLSKSILMNYANSQNLFGEKSFIVLDNFITENIFSLSKEDLASLMESQTVFVFYEDKLLASEQKKYIKYGSIENFDKKIDKVYKSDSFAIADSFGERDKVKAWVLYNEAIEKGVTGEAVAGMLFWKIKTMMSNGQKVFSKQELKSQSSRLVSIYHKSHNGELDIFTGLEHFILSALSK